MFDEADIDRIILAAAAEFFRAVERIDKEVRVAVRRNAPGGDLLLCNHRNARRSPSEGGQNDLLRRTVRHRDRR